MMRHLSTAQMELALLPSLPLAAEEDQEGAGSQTVVVQPEAGAEQGQDLAAEGLAADGRR